MKKVKSIFYLSNSYCYLLLFFIFSFSIRSIKKIVTNLTTNPAETFITMMKTDIL